MMKSREQKFAKMIINIGYFIFTLPLLIGCGEAHQGGVEVNQKFSLSKNSEQPIFFKTLDDFQQNETIHFLEAEFSAKLFVEDGCLKIHILGDMDKKYLLVLNKHQKVVKDQKEGIKEIKDVRTSKNIKLNQIIVASGVSFDLSKPKPTYPTLASCSEPYLIVGEFK